jgi:hypothetical protein
MRRFSRRLLLASSLAAFVIVAAGCEQMTITSQTPSQKDLIGPAVQVKTVLEGCDNGDPINVKDFATCDAFSNEQVLVGYRVPSGTVTPDSFDSTAGSDMTFQKSSSLASELQRLVPAASGEEWVGYISGVLDLPATTNAPQTTTLDPSFGLPPGFSASSFTYNTVVGYRGIGTITSTDPVTCGTSSLFSFSTDGSTNCGYFPTTIDDVNADHPVGLNDLSLSAGAPPSVHPGDTATVPFVAKLTGPALSGGSFDMSASSPLSGATAAPGSPTLSPSPGDNAIAATLKVPANAAPGDYPVTLTAAKGAQSRQATSSVHVVALPPLSIVLGKGKFSKSGVLSLPLSCPATSVDPCVGTVTLTTAGKVLVAKKHKARKRVLKLASGKFNIAPGKSSTVKLKLSKAGRKALAKTGRLSTKLTFVLTNRAGAKNTTVKHLTLKGLKQRKKHRH